MQSVADYQWFVAATVLITVALFLLSAYVVRRLGRHTPMYIAVTIAALTGMISAVPPLVGAMH